MKTKQFAMVALTHPRMKWAKEIRMLTRVRYETLSYVGVITAIILGLYVSSLFSYPLFHSLIEIATIAISFTLFILAWNARRFLTNDCLKFVGIGYAFIAVIDLLHTLAYKGMAIFPGYGANLPTQLWVAARFLQAVTLCMAPFLVRRRISGHFLFGAYFVAVATVAALVFSGNFPDCYVEGKGLTLFKIISEYAISAMLIVSLILFHNVRKNFNGNVYALIIASIACTAVSEISFTAYLSVYGFANMMGHLLKLAAFYLIYRALLVTGLKEPFDLIFRDLKQTEEALLKAHDSLEDKVRERTAALRDSEEKYRGLIQKIQVAVVVHGADTRILTSNLLAQQLIGFTEEQLMGKSGFDPDWHFFREDGTAILPEEYPVNQVLTSKQPIRNAVAGVHCPGMEEDVWVLVSADPVLDEQGEMTQVIVTFVDITERKRAEEVLRRMNRELRAVSNCNQVLMRAVDEQTLLYEICRIICDEAGYRMAWVGYAENDDVKSVRPVAWAGVEEGYLATANITWADTEQGRGPTGTAVRSGKSAWIKDFTTDSKAAPWRDGALQRGYRSSIAIPLKDESGNTFGALTIYSTAPDTFNTPDEVRLLEELTDDLAFGITVLRVRNARKEAERNIALLSFALDNVHEAAFLIDESAHFRYVNEESCRALGYARDELLGLGMAEIDPDFPMERWDGHWDELKTRGSLTFESRYKGKDGGIFPVEIYANYFEYYDAGYILALVRDITERERHDRLLMAREREFRTLAENSPDSILRYDNGCRCIYANPGIENTLGIPAGGMPGKTPMEIFPAGEYREYQDRIEEVLRTGADADLEVVIPDTGEGIRYHHVRFTAERDQEGAITGVLVIGRDITTRKEAEEEIRRLKNYLANIIDSMPSILVGMDRDEVVTQWNRQAADSTGISAAEAVGRPITQLFPDFSPWIMAMRSEIDQQRPASMEKLLIEKEGERRFYDLMLYPLIANGVEGTVVSIEDVTEQARIQELMIQTEKMISVGGLAAGMAHEINNPLGIITQAAQNIERRVSPELPANRKAAEELGVSLERVNAYFEKRQIPEFIGSIRTAGFRAAKIVANMLQFSRCAGTTMQPVSLVGIIEQALELAAGDYDLKKKFDFRSIEIIRDYAHDMPEVPIVVVEMEQVMLNLLKNAAQAMTSNPPDRRPRITLRLGREERYALIEVEDNGPGMEEDVRRRVFEPFFTTKEPGLGTGLGLSVSYMIVTQNHKGLMEVESKPCKGACFRVRLPLSRESIHG
jgi:PAS domain S-box-containing protein